MPRLTEATAIKRRLHILHAAIESLFARGFAATSIDDVCARAGISKGAFYSHFESKESLIHAVADLLAGELGPLDASSVEAFADTIFERQIGPALTPQNSRFGLEMMAVTRFDDVLRRRMITDLENVRTRAEAAIIQLVAAGLARPDADGRAVASIIQAHLLGALARNAVMPCERESLRAEVRLLVTGLIGLGPTPRPSEARR